MLTFADIKSELDITWNDEDTDSKARNAARRAQSTVGSLIGVPGMIFVDLESTAKTEGAETEAEQLFLDCCRYMYNHVYEDFRKNFADTILSLRAFYTVTQSDDEEVTEDA